MQSVVQLLIDQCCTGKFKAVHLLTAAVKSTAGSLTDGLLKPCAELLKDSWHAEYIPCKIHFSMNPFIQYITWMWLFYSARTATLTATLRQNPRLRGLQLHTPGFHIPETKINTVKIRL